MHECFRLRKIPDNANRTFIVLIPKVKSAANFNKFRPISLCNFSYKIVAKIITLRLSGLLERIISPNQGAFVKGWWIAENTVIAQELMHKINKHKGKKGLMMLKMDMKKAYDRMEWSFIDRALMAWGFAEPFRDLIGSCVNSVTFSLLLNGNITKTFTPGRGLRQGDPLSPYLFIFCSEFLSRLLHREERDRHINGVKISCNAPAVTHLLYADDLLLASRASDRKSRKEIQSVTGLKCMKKGAIYLGNALIFNKSKVKEFGRLKERVQVRLDSWKHQLLSKAGKATLIKSVIQAIPIYTMATYKIPAAVCHDLDTLVRRFWWGAKPSNAHYLALKAWKDICKPKSMGGLGFRLFKDMNLAMLSKLGWKLASGEKSLLTDLLVAKYLKGKSFFQYKAKKGDSFVWKGILSSRSLLAKNSCFKIGDGCHINFWEDPWILDLPHRIPTPKEGVNVSNWKVVADFKKSGFNEWDLEALLNTCEPATV